jgi:hypothetical protein
MTKSVLLAVAFLSLAACTQATETASQSQSPEVIAKKTTTVQTVVMCEQGDGDQYKSVGVALADGPGFEAYLVEHDVDDDSHKLVQTTLVSETKQGDATVYADAKDTFKLTITKDPHMVRLNGTLSILADGPGGTRLENLDCFEKEPITFDAPTSK